MSQKKKCFHSVIPCVLQISQNLYFESKNFIYLYYFLVKFVSIFRQKEWFADTERNDRFYVNLKSIVGIDNLEDYNRPSDQIWDKSSHILVLTVSDFKNYKNKVFKIIFSTSGS